jgi:heme-degrading monooxygenase HmoA
MILEVARLEVRPSQEDAFEIAMSEALPLIRATPGFVDFSLRRSIQAPNCYLLTVSWQTLEDHTIGFRQSDRYPKWRALLHHFYDPFPVVEHYSEPLSF